MVFRIHVWEENDNPSWQNKIILQRNFAKKKVLFIFAAFCKKQEQTALSDC